MDGFDVCAVDTNRLDIFDAAILQGKRGITSLLNTADGRMRARRPCQIE